MITGDFLAASDAAVASLRCVREVTGALTIHGSATTLAEVPGGTIGQALGQERLPTFVRRVVGLHAAGRLGGGGPRGGVRAHTRGDFWWTLRQRLPDQPALTHTRLPTNTHASRAIVEAPALRSAAS